MSKETIEVGQEFIHHHGVHNYKISLVEYETGVTATTLKALLSKKYKGPSSRTADLLKKFMKEWDRDKKVLQESSFDQILLEPVRVLHLGKRYETMLNRGNVYSLQDLLLSDKRDLSNRTNLGRKALENLEDLLKPNNLKLGMDLDQVGESSTTMTVDVKGSRGQVQAAIHSMTRHIRNRMDVEGVKIKLKANAFKEESPDNRIRGRYPFTMQFRLVCGDRKMEALNKRFRTGEELADFFEEIAARIRPIKNVRDFQDSDLWVLEV